MADNFMMNVSENFNLQLFSEEITKQYQMKGFQVNALQMKDSVKLMFQKDCGGINSLLGLGQSISATCTLTGKDHDTLSVAFTDAEWTSKIIGLAVGWFLCLIPFITAIVGVVRQNSLPKSITSDMQMTASNL